MRTVTTADYHTAGEPYRIVTGGVPPLRGATVLDKRSDAQLRLDDVRAMVVNEPRGHADMYGCFLAPPDDDGAEFAMIFFHKDGFSTACGHGTIAGSTWALEAGVVPQVEPVTSFAVDVPSGRLQIEADVVDGRVGMVRFVNVPAAVRALDLAVEVDGQPVMVDVAYGGAHYAVVSVADLDEPLTVEPANIGRFINLARSIKAEMVDHEAVQHPTEPRLSGLYGVIFYESDPALSSQPPHNDAALSQRNITVFGDGEVDRSPCGSGTSARLAVLYRRGLIGQGEVLSHRGIAGGLFAGRVLGVDDGNPDGGVPDGGVITEIGGRASVTGYHTFMLEDDDEMGLGFQFR